MSSRFEFIRLYSFVFYIFCSAFVLGETSVDSQNPVIHAGTYPQVEVSKHQEQKKIKRGEYLVKLGDCVACHTEDANKPFAGGLGLDTPFGTFYAPNITPDKNHGIGQWNDEEFINAMRHGIAPDGSNYFPVFPYLYYNRVTTEDLLAMKAYLQAIPAIDKPNKKHDVGFPFNIRFLQYFWKILFFYPYEGVFKMDASKTKKWNRGAYLVEGLAHCGMCHTPINFLGGPKRHLAFTGNIIDGWKAPNITGTNLKKVTEDDLVRLFLYDDRISGQGKLAEDSPMRLVNHDSLEYIDQSDLYAISTYVKSTVDPHPMKSLSADASQHEKAKYTYQKYCSGCHDTGTGGAPKTGSTAWQELVNEKGKDSLKLNAIKGYKNMPARGLCVSEQDEGCSDEGIGLAVDYILEQSAGLVKVKKSLGKKPKQYSPQEGSQLYQKYCSSCHSTPSNAPQLGDFKAWKPLLAKGVDTLLLGTIYGKSKGTEGCEVIKGNCEDCSDAQIIAAAKHLIQASQQGKDYHLW